MVVGDGGDFVSYAGRVIETYEPGRWMDPGPFGCLGAGPGYAMAAKLANPDSPVCLLLGDGAFGFSGMEFDTLVRHGIPVVAVMGNNGIWGLEKHPMEFLYGYSVAADLQPECRYDQVVEALGGHGELVSKPRRAAPGAGPRLLLGQARAGQRADRPERGLPAPVEPGLDGSLHRRVPAPVDVGGDRAGGQRQPVVDQAVGQRGQRGVGGRHARPAPAGRSARPRRSPRPPGVSGIWASTCAAT